MAGLIDALYNDDNIGLCEECGEEHVLCLDCRLCLKYCHEPDYCAAWDNPYDDFYESEFDCGFVPEQGCQKAGSEECEFECPYREEHYKTLRRRV